MNLLGFPVEELTFDRMLARKAEINGDKTFIHYLPDGRKLSYRDVDQLSNRIANGLLGKGVGKGTHVAVMMENCPETILTFFALGKLGAIFAPLNPAARGIFLEYYINHSDATAIVVEEHLLDQVRDIAQQVPQLTQCFVLKGAEGQGEIASAPSPTLTEIDFASLLQASDARTGIETKYTDLCSLMYTSGTTGPSKGNMFTQAHTMLFGIPSRRAQGLTSADTIYCALPLFHAGAWNTYTCGSLLDDGQIALVRRFSASRFWDEIRASGSTVAFLTAVTHFLEAQPPSPGDLTHGLRTLTCGPMPVDPIAFQQRFGVRYATNFGLSDFSLTNALGPQDPPTKYRSCGRPIPGFHVKIVDDEDFEVASGEAGEIVVRGDIPWSTSLGYYKDPEATAAAWRNGWFHTGDRGAIDDDGYLWYRDRKKDALRRRGENISAAEVEAGILRHPAIAEVAVYGIKAEGTDDEVAASIVLKDGAELDPFAFIEFCGRTLPFYVVPRFVEFIPEIPRTLNYKVQKVKLRDAMQAGWQSAWDREAHGIHFKRKTG